MVVGVNSFQTEEPPATDLLRVNEAAQEAQVASVQTVRAQRDSERAAALLRQIEDAARQPEAPLMPLFVEAVRLRHPGQDPGVLRSAFGEYQPPVML